MRLAFALPLLPLIRCTPLVDLAAPLKWAFEGAESVVGDDKTQLTIWQQLKDDDKYSKLVKVLKFEEDTIKDLDKKDDKYAITFFAVNDDGLKRPGHDDDHDDDLVAQEDVDDYSNLKTLSMLAHALDNDPSLLSSGGDDDDKKKKRRKRMFKAIAHAVLQYHILPGDYSAQALAQNSTMATALKPHDGSSDGLARRVHLQKHLVPPSLVVNFYATVQSSNEARNGKLHEINHPLFPPGSIFEGMFMVSKYLSTTTSAIQRVHGRHYVDWEYDHEKSKKGKPKFKGSPIATMFAPSNDAWDALPPHLHAFLFSKFGQRVLDKLLAYHYVPNTLVLAEVLHCGKHKKHFTDNMLTLEDNDPSFHREVEIPSGLGEKAKLKVVIDKTLVLPVEGATKTTIKVNDVEARIIDVPARNGGWHVLDKVLCPPHKHHKDHFESEDGEWAGWETWLPQWADEE